MTAIAFEVLFILALILTNGLFAMSEIAVLSARKVRLQQRADAGERGARVALALANAPNRFLSTVQVGITLVGIMTGVISGATIAEELAAWLAQFAWLAPYSRTLGVGLVVLAITYLSLVLGELVPKRLALAHAERLAALVAPPLQALSRLAAPLVYSLSASTELIARAFGIKAAADAALTEDEVRLMIEQGADAGVFEPGEHAMVERVFRLGDRTVSALMTPRPQVAWLDLDDPPDEIRRKVVAQVHSRYPVAQGDLDHVVGLVYARDLLAQILADQQVELRALMRPPLFVPESLPALGALERFRETRCHIAFVVDEYGGFQGVLALADLMEAVVGDMPLPGEAEAPEVVRREDGSWLVDGRLAVDELKEVLSVTQLPGVGGYQTVGGLVMDMLGQVPAAGDHFVWSGFRFEVVDMDARRVDKVLIVPPRG